MNKIDTFYISHSIADYDLNLPGNRKVGKGGVALLWHKKCDNKITVLPIESDRIIGVQYEMSSNCFLYIIQVYLPSKNHSIFNYREQIEILSDIVSLYSNKGQVVLMGDINANLSSSRFVKPLDDRGLCFTRYMYSENLVSINTLDCCLGANTTYVSPNGQSLIDHIIVPIEKIDMIKYCEILDDGALNVSNHRPIFCQMVIPQVYENQSIQSESRRIKWSKCSEENKLKFENILNNNIELNYALSLHLDSCGSFFYAPATVGDPFITSSYVYWSRGHFAVHRTVFFIC